QQAALATLISDLLASSVAAAGFRGQSHCFDEARFRLDLSWSDASGSKSPFYAEYSTVDHCRSEEVPHVITRLVDAAWQLREEIIGKCPRELGTNSASPPAPSATGRAAPGLTH